MDDTIKAYSFAIIAAFSISINFVITKIILGELNPISTGFYSFALSLVFSFIYIKYKKLSWVKAFRSHWKHMTMFGLIFSIAAIIWFYSIDAIGPNITSFLQRFTVIFTIILGVIFLKEKFNRFEAIGMIIAVIGALIMTYTTESIFIISAILVIIMSALFAFSQLIVKTHSKKIDSIVINHIRILFATVFLFAFGLLTSSFQMPSLNAFILCGISGLIAGLIGVILFFKALELAELSKVNVVRVMDPFIVMMFSFVFLNTVPTAQQFAGGIFIAFGVILLIIARHRPKIILRWFT